MVTFSLRQKSIQVDGRAYVLRELNGEQALALWPAFSDAEKTGNVTVAYGEIVRHGLLTTRATPVFESADEALRLPARLLMFFATEILALSEIGLEASQGNVSSDQVAA